MLVFLPLSTCYSFAMNKNAPIIQTERLHIRPLTVDDIPAIAAMFADEEVMKFSSCRRSLSYKETSDLVTEKIMKEYDNVGFSRYAVIKKDDDTLIGYAGFTQQTILAEEKFIDLGYAFAKKYWGKGYATETAQALVAYARSSLRLPELGAVVSHENTASQKVILKSGFSLFKNITLQGHTHYLYKINLEQ